MSDGLSVPFTLAAGLPGAIDSTSIIVTEGLAEIAAGSIAKELGGYMAAQSDVEHYISESAREEAEVRDKADSEAAEVSVLSELSIRLRQRLQLSLGQRSHYNR